MPAIHKKRHGTKSKITFQYASPSQITINQEKYNFGGIRILQRGSPCRGGKLGSLFFLHLHPHHCPKGGKGDTQKAH